MAQEAVGAGEVREAGFVEAVLKERNELPERAQSLATFTPFPSLTLAHCSNLRRAFRRTGCRVNRAP